MSLPSDPQNAAARIGVVVVNYRTAELTVRCVRALVPERSKLPEMRVVVVDGGSGDGSAELLEHELADLTAEGWLSILPLEINGGFGFANNRGILEMLQSEAPPEFIYLVNPDAEVEEGAVEHLVAVLRADRGLGAAGSLLLEADGTPSGSAFSFPSLRGEFARGARTALFERLLRVPPVAIEPQSKAMEVDWVTGASVMFRAAALRDAGLFDHGFFLYHEEVELMWRLRRHGWRIAHVPQSRVRHLGGASTGVHSRPGEKGAERPRPAYWYESRRRAFVLMRGSIAGAAAPLCWLAGHLVWRLRALSGWGSGRPVPNELRDHFRHMGPFHQPIRPAVARLEGPRLTRPAWMTTP